jgi:integrase
MLYTTQRRGDVVGLGKQHRIEDRFELVQQKTGVALSLPIHDDLADELDLAPDGDLLYLMTEQGKPYTSAGFGNWFRRQCDAAGLPQCSAHGLRKAGARRMAEAGKSHAEIKSVTGHVTDKEVTRYTRAADQRRLSDRAIDALSGTKAERKNG